MIFGRTYADTLSEIECRLARKYYRLYHWHRWFAWYPICLPDGRFVWLETIERRADPISTVGIEIFGFEYRLTVSAYD